MSNPLSFGNPEIFLHLGATLLGKQGLTRREFNSIFGCTPKVAGRAWRMLRARSTLPVGFTSIRMLLWALVMLKQYPTQDFLAAICKVSGEPLENGLGSSSIP
jgi:methylphosphotriester-DNA--protein-cysteine methyltransferase